VSVWDAGEVGATERVQIACLPPSALKQVLVQHAKKVEQVSPAVFSSHTW
jgi:hypothetical protein